VIDELKIQLEKLKEREIEQEINGESSNIMPEEAEEERAGGQREDAEGSDNGAEAIDHPNEDTKSDSGDIKKDTSSTLKPREPKSLLSNAPGYGTLYKTPGKDNQFQKSTKFK
jgi:hypothetical protein